MMIAIWSAKGGVGVSTLALGLAKAMQKENPFLIDFNLSSPTLAAMMGMDGTNHGLDRVLVHSDSVSIGKSLKENWVTVDGLTLLPGVHYSPAVEVSHELFVRTLKEQLGKKTVIVDAGFGVLHPLQKELLLRADVIMIVVTPYLMSYHNLWQMWQNDFFIPYEQSKKAGVIVNQFQGSVTAKDIATLMDVWLAGELPVSKKMTDAINHGNIDEAFAKPFLKKLYSFGQKAVQRMEKTNMVVKQYVNKTPASSTVWEFANENGNQSSEHGGREWKFES